MRSAPPQPIYIQQAAAPAASPPPITPPPEPLPPPPSYNEPAADPLRDLLVRRTESDQLNAIGDRVRDASSRLMMQYGTRRALGGGSGSPLMG